MIRSHQIPLNLNLRDDAVFDNFLVGQNAPCLHALKNSVMQRDEQFIYCYGDSGVGRTHLLQACCHLANENKQSVFYLPLSTHSDFSPAIFESLETMSLVCIDDIDAVIGNKIWEEALFHFYNRARDCNVTLIVSAALSPQQLPCVLNDLHSRLCWGLSLEIKHLNDSEKMQALQMRAASRGIQLPNEVVHYFISHYSRNMHDLLNMLDKLDRASLIAKRKITVPFLKLIMQE